MNLIINSSRIYHWQWCDPFRMRAAHWARSQPRAAFKTGFQDINTSGGHLPPYWISSCLLSHPDVLLEGMGFPGTLDALNTLPKWLLRKGGHTVSLKIPLSGKVGQPWSSAEALGSQLFPTAGNYICASSYVSQISKRIQILPKYSSWAQVTAWVERFSTSLWLVIDEWHCFFQGGDW